MEADTIVEAAASFQSFSGALWEPAAAVVSAAAVSEEADLAVSAAVAVASAAVEQEEAGKPGRLEDLWTA